MDSRLENRDPSLLEAIEFYYSNRKASIRFVAKKFDVNRSTLRRHLIRPTTRGLGQESNQRFSWRHERFLVDWIKQEDTRGYAPSRSRVQEMAEKLLVANGMITHLEESGLKASNAVIPTFRHLSASE
jgi:transposase-like protein